MYNRPERDRLELGNSLEHKIDVHIRINISNYMIRSFIIGSAFPQTMTVWVKTFHLSDELRKFSD